jgi:GT2 family glycosyltransferase
MYSDNPLVSIITVSFNSDRTIRDTIESILRQTYEKIEYIVVDGLSQDNTVSIVKEYEQNFKVRGFIIRVISEKDKGLYDAMNKGVTIATGEIVGILNSDDFYTDEFVIKKVVSRIKKENADCLYADLQFVEKDDTSKIVRTWKAKEGDFRLGWNPPHPTTFISKEAYNKFGLYKVDYTISSDYDILYRIIHKGKVKVAYLKEFIVKMRSGGRSTSGIKSNIVASKEIYTTLKENNQKFKLPIILIRLLVKVKQFI